MSPGIDFIEVARIVDKILSKLDFTLSSNELPLVVCVADFRNIKVNQSLINQIVRLTESLTIEDDDIANLEYMSKYKGGFLAYVIADDSLEDLKLKAHSNQNDLKYQFLLKVFDLLSAMKVGGGFAKDLLEVKSLLKNHPLYKLRNNETTLAANPQSKLKY